jgi:hypothetical protein
MVLKNHYWEAGYQQAEPPSADRAKSVDSTAKVTSWRVAGSVGAEGDVGSPA